MDSLCLDAESPEPYLPRRGARDAAPLPRREDRGDPLQSTRIWQIDARLVIDKHASFRNRSNRQEQIRCDRRDRSTGHTAGRGHRGTAWGSARAYRTGLAVTEETGDGTNYRS